MENEVDSRKIFHRFMVFIIGVALSIAGTAMLISGTFNLDKFYDVGEVYDVHSATLKSYPVNMVYDYNNDCFVLQETTGRKGINLGKNHEKKWNYIVIELANMNVPNIMGRIDYHNSKNELVHYKDVSLVEGTNIISSENVKYSQIIVNFFSAAGTMVKIDKIQFREQAPVFSWKVAILYFSMILGIYYLVIQLIKYMAGKKNIHIPINEFLSTVIDGFQLFYMKVGDYGKNLFGNWSREARRKCRILCIVFMFIYMQVVSYHKIYITQDYFKYHMYICSIVILLLGFLCWEKPLQLLDWNSRFVKVWFVFWFMAAVSEFLVPKKYLYQSIIMLFFMGFFYFMWNNMKDREEILRNFRKALELWFWINVPYCYLFEPYTGVRYLGASKNPNEWAMYLIFALAAFLSEVELEEESIRGKKLIKKIIYFSAIGMILDFILKTGSSSGLIPALLMIGYYVFKQMKDLTKKNNGKILGRCGGYFLVGSMAVILMMGVNDIALKKVSFGLGITKEAQVAIEDENDLLGMVVNAAEESEMDFLKNNRVVQKVLNSASLEDFTTGRNLYWMGYLREMNLWGHENNPVMWGKRRTAHNGLIAIIYRYGIFSAVPYLLMIGYYLLFAVKYKEKINQKTKMQYFILSITGSVGILLFMENVEYPFHYINWYNLYLVMGIYFGNKPQKQHIEVL